MTERHRRVVLGISGHRTAHLIDWAARLLWRGDRVHIVHVYQPIPYAASDWQLPLDKAGPVHTVMHQHVGVAADRLRRKRPDLVVTEELAGRPIDLALTEAARTAELVLLGIPHWDRNRNMLIRVLAEMDCPLLLIGSADPSPTGTVAAVLRGDQSDDAVLSAAFEQAQRQHCGVLVLKRWQPPLDGNLRYAETAEQKVLDSYLAGWQQRYPHLGVTAELRFGESLADLIRHGAQADLLVLPLPERGADPGHFRAALDEVLTHRSQPTLLIPQPVRHGVGHPPAAELGRTSMSTGASNG
jgi:universal stress protein family protein